MPPESRQEWLDHPDRPSCQLRDRVINEFFDGTGI
jgi:hypothetical protein